MMVHHAILGVPGVAPLLDKPNLVESSWIATIFLDVGAGDN